MTVRNRIDLSCLDDAFSAASLPSTAPLPDGPYTVQVDLVELRQTRSTARPMLCWTLRILPPSPFAGRRLWRNHVLTPQSLAWLKKDLRLCGLELAKLSDLPEHLPTLRGTTLQILKRTRGDFDSISFRRATSAP
jgi:hypothetical protein